MAAEQEQEKKLQMRYVDEVELDPDSDEEGEQREITEEDVWAIVVKEDRGLQWKDKTCNQRFKTVLIIFAKLVVLIGLLYLFVCSLGMLSDAFRLLGGKEAAEAFRNNDILSNPIADLVLGVLVTVLLQSSSTTTSIVVAMVAAGTLPIRPAIFIVMGANIGTSVTNTIVSMGQVYDRNEFRRAFAGATVHDMFNWLSVLILLPIEWLSGSFGSWTGCGLLCQLTYAITKNLEQGNKDAKRDFLKVITKPFTSRIMQLDKKALEEIAKNSNISTDEVNLIKHGCDKKANIVGAFFNNETQQCELQYGAPGKCGFLFEDVSYHWSNAAVGACLLILALFILMFCLVMIVKLLHSLLKGAIARAIQKILNAKLPGKASFLTGYIAILLGTGLTMLVQSSSIFTSAMTPLVGAGVLHLKRMYPLTLGANIGTTFTAMLAALASDGEKLQLTMQVALCHFFFNVVGIIIWYPAPQMRAIPIGLAKKLGNITAKHRWFALVYLLIMFFLLPAAIFGISLAGWKVALGVLLPFFVLFIIIVTINVMQNKCKYSLPVKCRSWECCPPFLHRLSFYDQCCKCFARERTPAEESESKARPVGNEADIATGVVNIEPPPAYNGSSDIRTAMESNQGYTNAGYIHSDGSKLDPSKQRAVGQLNTIL